MENEPQPLIPPIAAPTGDVVPLPSVEAGPIDLRALALWHRRMLLTLLFSCFTDFTSFAATTNASDHPGPIASMFSIVATLLVLGGAVLRTVTVLKVTQTLRDFGPWLAAIMSFIGCFGFFVILSLNKRARQRLRAAGIRVGFWGASVKNVPV